MPHIAINYYLLPLYLGKNLTIDLIVQLHPCVSGTASQNIPFLELSGVLICPDR